MSSKHSTLESSDSIWIYMFMVESTVAWNWTDIFSKFCSCLPIEIKGGNFFPLRKYRLKCKFRKKYLLNIIYMVWNRLGGFPMGVIAVETRAVEFVIAADPGNLDSDSKVSQSSL